MQTLKFSIQDINFFNKNFDLVTYTFYNKRELQKQIDLDFKFKKNIKIIQKKIHLKKIHK